jgi:hypothetical protein
MPTSWEGADGQQHREELRKNPATTNQPGSQNRILTIDKG